MRDDAHRPRRPRGTLATIVDAAVDGPGRTGLILVGRVLAAEDFDESSLYANGYDRRFRPQTADSPFAGPSDDAA